MSLGGFDEEILQDFLTECGELLESLEHDLMALEATPNDADLLNTVFRALHTIKGSASFLTLTQLVSVTHAAETALNAARNGRLSVDRTVMDLLLEAVDLVREHFAQIQAGEPLSEPDAKLIAELTRLGEGGDAASESAPASATEAETPEPPIETGSQTQTEAKTSAETGPLGSSVLPLELDSSKLDLLEFLVTDAEDALGSIGELAVQLKDDASRATACQEIVDLLDALRRTVDFFEFAEMCEVVDALRATATMIEADDHPNVDAPVAIAAAVRLLGEQIDGLKERRRLVWPTSSLIEALAGVAEGREIEAINPEMDAMEALVALGVVHDGQPVAPPATPAPVATATEPAAPDPTTTTSATTSTTAPDKPGEARGAKTAVEQTIRVEVGRLESLMNLVGELVLQKNRVSAVNREIASDPSIPQETRESVAQATSDLDRVTGDIQLAVMRTRMQPLDKLFGKYPRLIRDLAKKTGKQIELVIEGGDTEVDKSVLEELGDPLVHLMRNSADHGLEPPDERAASDKQTTGRITLSASNEGGSVSVRIIDDGRGLPRDRLGAKAVERGLVTEQELAQMSDRDVYRFIFHPGFSTADEVSDLSGRGVGMDVVRTNIERLKGSVDVDSTPGNGTVITLLIPLTVAILPAMMVRVAGEIYAVPLGNILEIVRPSPEQLGTIQERPVMRLRDDVLPLIDACDVFDVPEDERTPTPFAVVLSLNEKRVGLTVSGLIGQQEVVIKPLDTPSGEPAPGPFGGTTVRDDGGVSLIVDIAELMRQAEGRQAEGRASDTRVAESRALAA